MTRFAMTRFTMTYVAGSRRWIGPLVLWLAWTSIVGVGDGSATNNAVGSFAILAACGAWITVLVGNMDDDHHRELMSAELGSPVRLHLHRAAVGAAGTSSLAAASAVIFLVTANRPASGPSLPTIAFATITTVLAAALAGVGLGTLLHRPIVRSRAITVVGGVLGLIVLVVLPPVQAMLRAADEGTVAGGFLLLAVMGSWFAAACGGASRLAGLSTR